MKLIVSISGGWLRVGVMCRLNRGSGGFTVSIVAGADVDLPWRPWPTMWAEQRGKGGRHVLIALVWCGLGLAVQTFAGRPA